MALPTALLAKGLAGLGVVAAGTTGIVLFINNDPNKAINENIRALGISGCALGNGETKKENCSITGEQLKNVKFSKDGTEVNVTDSSKNLTLTIEKGYETADFPDGLRFIFKNPHASEDVTIGSNSNQITLKAGVSYDFKIKDGTKLEKAWDLTTIGTKVGLNCTTPSNGGDITECDLTTGKINVWKSNNDYITEATISDTTKKMTVAKDTKDHNGGFKLTVTDDINLTQNTEDKKLGTVEKLSKDNTTYEIDLKDHKGTKKWFLVEKPTTTPS